jgi:hypothetical protein
MLVADVSGLGAMTRHDPEQNIDSVRENTGFAGEMSAAGTISTCPWGGFAWFH